MASIDVPVALLGYGTVGAAVNRLLVESADDIERATGHRLRVVKALVRDIEKHRSFPAPEGVLTTLRLGRRGRLDRGRRRGDGWRRAGRRLRLGAAEPRQERRLGQQATCCPTQAQSCLLRPRAQGAAAVRGQCLRGDPGDQGAPRVADRHERPPRPRHRQRHDQLHPDRDGERLLYDEALAEARAPRVRRGRPDRRRERRRRRGARWRSSRRWPFTLVSSSPMSRMRGSRRSRSSTSRRPATSRWSCASSGAPA